MTAKKFYERLHSQLDLESVHLDPIMDLLVSHIIRLLGVSGKHKGRILDIGCREGTIIRLISRRTNSSCFGIDLSKVALKKAGYLSKCLYVVANAEELPFKNDTFDFIILNHVLEHIPRDEMVISGISRILRKKGKLYLASPNDRTAIHPVLVNHREKVDKREGHLRSYSSSNIKLLLKKNDLDVLLFNYGGHFFSVLFLPKFLHLAGYFYKIINIIRGKRHNSLLNYKTYRGLRKNLFLITKWIEKILFSNKCGRMHDFDLLASKRG